MTLYVIGIGGTGAKCLEAVIQVSALGLISREPVRILFVDADDTNGNLERTRNSLRIYQQCHDIFKSNGQESSWMQTPIVAFDQVWSPFGSSQSNSDLANFFSYNILKQSTPALGNLLDVLYTPQERQANLDVGFRGRPAIGAAVMSQLELDDLDQEPWGSFLKQIQSEAASGQEPKIFLCGSIFGGTGASGLPTLGRLLHDRLKTLTIRGRVKIGCLFALPYFGFTTASGESPDGVYARSDHFLLNTEAALRYYYGTRSWEMFDTVYLIGNQNASQMKKFSIGKKTQCNESHFVELYAGLAVRQFLTNRSESEQKVVLMSRQGAKQLSWNDLPDQESVKAEMTNATRFACSWLFNLAQVLEEGKAIGVPTFQKSVVWFSEFFRPRQGWFGSKLTSQGEELPEFDAADQQATIEAINNWCRDYLRWLYELHQCDGDAINLFSEIIFADPDRKTRLNELSSLIVGDTRDGNRRSQDTVESLTRGLVVGDLSVPNQGTAGLARAFYRICRL